MPTPAAPWLLDRAAPLVQASLTPGTFPLMTRSDQELSIYHSVDSDRPTPWFLDLAGVLRRHLLLVVIAVAACGWSAFEMGQRYHQKVWLVEGRLRLIRAPIPEAGRPMYEPMSLATHVDLITSDPVLKPLADEFRGRLPWADAVPVLRKELRVESPRQSDVVDIRWESADPRLAIDLVNRLMARYIEYSAGLRRATVLRQATDLLKHRIESCDGQIAAINKATEEYQARTRPGSPVTAPDAVELDQFHNHRRKTVFDLLAQEKVKLKDKQIELASRRDVVRELDEQLRMRVIAPVELAEAQRKYRDAKQVVTLVESEVRRLEELYREIPVEYANARIVELQTRRTEAELDLKLMAKKAETGGSLTGADAQDEEWGKLCRKLIGPDTPEFVIMTAAGMPAQPSSSNRKMITALGFAVPMGLIFLTLAYSDHRRRTRLPAVIDRRHPYTLPAVPRDTYLPARQESAILAVRIQQWLADRSDGPPPRDCPIDADRPTEPGARQELS